MAQIILNMPDNYPAQLTAAICSNFNYQSIIPNPANGGAPMANPLSPEQFAQSKLVEWGNDQLTQYYAAQVAAAAATAAAAAQATITPLDPTQVTVTVQ